MYCWKEMELNSLCLEWHTEILLGDFFSGYILTRISEFNFQSELPFFPFLQYTCWYFECCILNAMCMACKYIMSQHYQWICWRIHVELIVFLRAVASSWSSTFWWDTFPGCSQIWEFCFLGRWTVYGWYLRVSFPIQKQNTYASSCCLEQKMK